MNASIQPLNMSQQEWELRVKLAHCYHLVDYFSWTETIFGGVSKSMLKKSRLDFDKIEKCE